MPVLLGNISLVLLINPKLCFTCLIYERDFLTLASMTAVLNNSLCTHGPYWEFISHHFSFMFSGGQYGEASEPQYYDDLH
jgi:hypothetical protein